MLESTTMSTGMLLDGSFGMLALLLLPVGYWRGLHREIFATAGVLTGAQLGAAWARPWGSDLADLVGARVGIGQFAVSAALLIGGIVLLGYGGAAAAGTADASRRSRIAGALLAVVNGILLAAFLLRDIERFLADEGTARALDRSQVASILLREFGWVLVGLASIAVLAVAASLSLGNRRALAPLPAPVGAWVPPPVPSAQRKPRLSWGSDEGKVEPADRAFDPASGRFSADAPSLHATMPIAPVAPAPDRAAGWNGNRAEWVEIAPRAPSGWPAPVANAESLSPSRCAGCGEPLTADDMFCPRCGRAVPSREP